MQHSIMAPTLSFFERLTSKSWHSSVPFDASSSPHQPQTQQQQQKKARPLTHRRRSKALSMFDLFSHAREQTQSVPLASPASLTSSPRPPRRLRKCASADAALTTSGWGMVPVLNELEQRASFVQNGRHRRSRCDAQRVCVNCRSLFFPDLSGIDDVAFCSLDCRASHTYAHDMQDVVDVQLDLSGDWSADGGNWSDSTSSTDSGHVSSSAHSLSTLGS